MNMKIAGFIILIAALLVSGVMYFKQNDTVQRQEATKAEASDDSLKVSDDDFDVFSEPPTQINEATPDTSVQSIPSIQTGSRDIIAIQQQIEARMIQCVQLSQRARAQYFAVRQREADLRERRDALNSRFRAIDTSTPEGRAQRDRVRAERDGLNSQIRAVQDEGNAVRRSFNEARGACRRDVSRLRTQQSRAHAALNRQFNQDVNVRFNFPN